MKIIALGHGKTKITPAIVDDIQCLLFEPVPEPHSVGDQTGDPPGVVYPEDGDTLLMLGNVASANVLLDQLKTCIAEMEKLRNKVKP